MGVDLGSLVKGRSITFSELAGKKIAIDAHNALYQFLAIIRQPTGEPLMDSKGNVTSHLSGLLYRTANLVDSGILPVYVFDGKPSTLKYKTIEARAEIRAEAEVKWKAALEAGELEEARVHAQAALKLTRSMVEDAKALLENLGIPVVQAVQEGEAQAAYMTMNGEVYASASQDYDSLLFGAKKLVRNLTITGKRKMPRKNIYIEVTPELFELDAVLRELGIDRERLIEIGIMIGTDYNPKGIANIGPKRAYKIIKEKGSLRSAVEGGALPPLDFNYEGLKEMFLNYEKAEGYALKWRKPDEEKVISFLCAERDFSQERVKHALAKMAEAIEKTISQSRMEAWFS